MRIKIYIYISQTTTKTSLPVSSDTSSASTSRHGYNTRTDIYLCAVATTAAAVVVFPGTYAVVASVVAVPARSRPSAHNLRTKISSTNFKFFFALRDSN